MLCIFFNIPDNFLRYDSKVLPAKVIKYLNFQTNYYKSQLLKKKKLL